MSKSDKHLTAGQISSYTSVAMKALVLATALLLTSCSFAPSDKYVEALAKDGATVCGRMHVVYGVGNGDLFVYRTNITNGTVKCGDDGLSVSSTPTTIPVGVQVVPAK